MNLDALAQEYGGTLVSKDRSRLDALAQEYGGSLVSPDNQVPAKPASTDRTWGEAFKDVGAGLVSGVGSVVQTPGQIYGLATGDFSKTGALGLGEDISQYGSDMKSEGLKARELQRNAKVQEAEKEGQWQAFKTGFSETITDPALATSFIAEQLPLLLPMIATGGTAAAVSAGRAGAAALAKGATKEAAAIAAKEAGIKAGSAAALQTGAAMQGADIGSGAYDEIYAELSKTMSPEKAAEETLNKARAAGVAGYGLSVLANKYLYGGKAIEEILSGKTISGSRIASGALTALKEIPSENVEEVGGKIAQNIAAKQAGLDKDLLSGTGETAALATIGAAGLGGVSGIAARKAPADAAAKQKEDAFKQEEEQFKKEFGAAEAVDAPVEEVPPKEFPGGYVATRREASRQEVPESFGIVAEGSDTPLATVISQADADKKLQTLSEIRSQEQTRLAAESEKLSVVINEEQRKIDVMEATGLTGTDEYVQATALLEQKKVEATEKIDELAQKITDYSAPLSIAPIGSKQDIQYTFDVNKGDESIGSFTTIEEAEAALREREPTLFKQADLEAQKQEEVQAEQETRQVDERVKTLETQLTPLLTKFNLQDVGLKVVKNIENNAGGKYFERLIQVAIDEPAPMQTMRHESMHALKDLGFFTPQQWKALEEQATKKWIKQYLYDQPATADVDGKPVTMSRFDAYKRLGYSQEAMIEEAIADAFGAYDKGAKPPPGMIAALFKKLKNFFLNLGQAMRGAGFESADDIFQRVERGELKSKKAKPASATQQTTKEETEQPEQTMGERLSLLRQAHPDEIDISTQNPQGVTRIYDPITEMLSIDEDAVREAMKANPKIESKIIQSIQAYGFIPNGTPNDKVLEVFRSNIVNNLMFLYNKVPASIRNRSKLWYNGANKISSEMADNYGMSLRQISAIMAAMSPQKDWFQNVSMGERAIDILIKHGDTAWTPDMLKYAKSYVKEATDRKEREKRSDAFEKIQKVAKQGTVLNDMDEVSAAAFIRAYDEAFHSRNYRIVTPEGGFGDLVRNNNGAPSTMMWSTYGPIQKAVSIFRDGSRSNISQQLGFEHKIRSFYNNIANPDSEIDHVTIDTHAVAAALFEAVAGTDIEVKHNFGATGSSDVLGVGGTYGLIADAYREAAKKAGIKAREMQSITWEAVRALFSEEVKATIKPKIRAEWVKYKTGQQSFEETRQNVLEIAGQPKELNEPDWVDSGIGQFVADGGASYDKTFTPVDGVRLRSEREIREKVTFNLSAVTKSIPGLRELYSQAMKGDDKAYELLQKVAESSLQYLLKGTGARIKIEYAKGVYQTDREPSISISAVFEESNWQVVMSALAQFADNYNQQQIHVRVPTIRKLGHDFGDGSYATPVYEIALAKQLNNAQISDIINQTGLQGFSVSEKQVVTKDKTTTENFLTAYWVAPNDIEQEFESFDQFEQAIRAAQALAGREGEKPRRSVERLYVYGEGPGARIQYEDIQSNVLPSEGTDTVTPRLIAEYLRGEPVKVFKQKDLTNKQVEGQKLLAQVFDELPVKDFKNPLVRKAYNALNQELVKQYNVMPIKVQLVKGQRDENGKFIDIYKNSAAMRQDVSKNNKFQVYKTEVGTFGPEGFNFSNHPLLKDSGLKDANGKPMLFNDVLRAVHDYYAHNLADIQFGPKGEAAAWRNHMSVTADPLARWALTTETRSQNAWQNFRDGVEDIPLKDRPYAEQKVMLAPIAFAFTGEANVDQIMAEYAATLTQEQQLGSLQPTSQYVGKVKKLMLQLNPKQAPSVNDDSRYSLKAPTTAAFKRWFGDSKVVDENGDPLVVSHATNRKFNVFKIAKHDIGVHFGELEQAQARAVTKKGETRIYEVYLSLKNPVEMDDQQDSWGDPQEVADSLEKWGHFSEDQLSPWLSGDGDIESLRKFLLDNGVDGIKYRNTVEGDSWGYSYIAFSPTQIKSATGNTGDFDGTNPDIRYSLKAPTTKEFKRWFSDSKVVDADGKPLLVYHSTYSDFAVPKVNYGADEWKQFGMHLGSVESATSRLDLKAREDNYNNQSNGNAGANIMPVYARIKNPLRLTENRSGRWGVDDVFGAIVNQAENGDPNLDWISPEFIDDFYNDGNILDDDADYSPDTSKVWQNTEDWDSGERTTALINWLATAGIDGIVYNNEFEGGGDSYIAFNPTQIKSAIGNNGNFDSTNPDIRYSLKAPTTVEFKRWFGGSTLLGANGEPKVMYHGTARDITEFQGKQAGAIFVTENPDVAGDFAKMSATWMGKHAEQFLDDAQLAEGKKQAIEAIRKDYGKDTLGKEMLDSIKAGNPTDEALEYLGKAYKPMMPSGPNIMPVYVRAETPFDYENPSHVQQVVDELNNNSDSWGRKIGEKERGDIARGNWERIETQAVQQAMRGLGFDSFYVREGGRKNLAVYSPTQIKSATGNSGDYSTTNPDIRYSLPSIPANMQGRIDETTHRREQKGFAQRMVEAISPKSVSHFRQAFLNRYNQMSVYDKERAKQMGGSALLADQSAESAALMSDLDSGVAASAMGLGDRHGGIPVLRNGITTINRNVKGLIASLSPLAAYGDSAVYQRYQYWAMVKRGVRLNAEGRDVGITTADVAFAKMLEQKHPEFVSVQKDLIAFNNGIVQFMVDTGVLSKERGQIYTKHADYIPFYRQIDGETTQGPNLFQSLSGVKPPKQLKGGSDAPIADFLETMVRNTQSSIGAGMKNYAAQRALTVASQVQAAGMGATRLNTKESGPDIINVLEKGDLVSYRTPDHLLINAMMSLNQSEIPFMHIWSAPANVLRSLVTKDPGFMMANLLRDSLSAWVTSGQSMTPIAGTVINFGKALVGKSKGYQAMIDAGILGGYEFSDNVEKSGLTLEKDLAKKAGQKGPLGLRTVTSLWEALEKGTTASDAATRALIYERVLADTGNEAEALFRSLEVMNFHRKGSSALIRVLTAAVPFFNARLQGLDLFYRASTGNMNNKDAAAIQRKFLARGATMMALSAMYWMLVSDDDEYKKQEQENKDNYWLLPSVGIRIPIPFEVGVLFKVIPERIAAYLFGDDTGEDLKNALKRNAMSTFAFNPVPQTVKPLVEALYDFNTFTWRPIVGESMSNMAPEYQTRPGTSKVATEIGGILGLSPLKVDHVIKGYTGTMGMYAIDTIDAIMDQFSNSPRASKRFEQLPVFRRFLVDPEARGNITQYYLLKDAVDTTVRTMNMLEKTGESEAYMKYLTENLGTFAYKDYIRDTEKMMKELREARRAVQSSSMSGDDKRDALTELGRAEDQITSQIQDIKKSIASMQ